jgi:hypothetical protein
VDASDVLAISIPTTQAMVIRHFRSGCLMGYSCSMTLKNSLTRRTGDDAEAEASSI